MFFASFGLFSFSSYLGFCFFRWEEGGSGRWDVQVWLVAIVDFAVD